MRRWSTFKSHATHSGLGRSHFHDSAVTDVVSAHETFFAIRRMSTCSFTSSKVSHDFELFICKSERWAELMGSGNQGSQNMDSKICAKRAFPSGFFEAPQGLHSRSLPRKASNLKLSREPEISPKHRRIVHAISCYSKGMQSVRT